MKEDKHKRILFALAGIISFLFYINPVVLGIMLLTNNLNIEYIKVCLIISMSLGLVGIPLSLFIITMTRAGVNEFKNRKPVIYTLMTLNTFSPIFYIISLKFNLISILIYVLLLSTSLCFVYENKINDKYYAGILIAKKTQMEQMKNIVKKEKEIEDNMKTEENEVAFGKTSSPSSPEQKKAQQIKEITILYETGLMDINEYRRLKDQILNKG